MNQSEVDRLWMAEALKLAGRASDIGEVPVGAVIVREDALLGEGFNQPISRCDPTAHAEVVALRAAAKMASNYRFPGATLYVTIEPCAMCAGAIIHSRVERVVFAATEPKAGAVCSHLNLFDQGQMNHKVQWEGGLMADEATALIQAFFARRRQEKKSLRD